MLSPVKRDGKVVMWTAICVAPFFGRVYGYRGTAATREDAVKQLAWNLKRYCNYLGYLLETDKDSADTTGMTVRQKNAARMQVVRDQLKRDKRDILSISDEELEVLLNNAIIDG
jgi:hypothetical protein